MTGSRRTIGVEYTETVDDIEPLKLSRDIERAAHRARAWLRRLREGEGLDDDPFEPYRKTCGRDTFVRVSEMSTDDPLREPLRRWVYRIAELRINRAPICRATFEYLVEQRPVDAPERGKYTLRAILHRALSEAPRRRRWLDVYFGAAEPLAHASRLLWERRAEIASRMGMDSSEVIEGIGVDAAELANLWLDRTRDGFGEFRIRSLTDFVASALGTDASEGWPGRLAIDALMDWFRDGDLFRSLEVDPGPFVAPIGASSFLRALERLGAAWADAAAPRDQPFVVAHDPYGLHRLTSGALFGSLPMEPQFAMRRLGISRARSADHRRRLARVRLLDSRAGALKVLLRRAALGGGTSLHRDFEELCERALGFGLSRAAALTMFRPHVDEPQRFAARLLAATRAKALREAHDEDWFRNPRAIEQLRAEAALSPEATTTKAAMESGMDHLQAELVDALK